MFLVHPTLSTENLVKTVEVIQKVIKMMNT